MNDILKDRLIRRLASLPDERLYQVMDYIEFLESRYAPQSAPAPNPLQRFAEGVEGTLRAGKVSAGAVAGTMSFMSKAVGVLNDVAAVGKSVATDIASAASSAAAPARPTTGGGAGAGSEQVPPSSAPAEPVPPSREAIHPNVQAAPPSPPPPSSGDPQS